MKDIKRLLLTPYPYIFFLTYYGIWLAWDAIHVPFSDPYHVVGFLSRSHYNPLNSILRFCLVILLPPALCLAFWLLQGWLPKWKRSHKSIFSGLGRLYSAALVVLSLVVLVSMAIVQSSTSGTNDPYTYGGPYKYTLVDTFHEGETLGSAVTYEQRDLKPYKNIVFVHGVYQDPVRTILAFKLFGMSIGAERTFASISAILTFILLYVFLLLLFRWSIIKASLTTLLLALTFLPTQMLPGISSFFVGYQLPPLDFQTILFLGPAILAIRAMRDKREVTFRLCSFVVGFVTLAGFANAIDRALFIVALTVIWLVMLLAMLPWRRFLLSVIPYFLFGSVLGIVVLGIALKGDFKDFAGFLFHISQFKEYMDGLIFARPDKSVAVSLLGLSAALAFAGARFIGIYGQLPGNAAKTSRLKVFWQAVAKFSEEHYVFVLLLATAIFFLRSAIGRADIGHFSYSLFWTYLFFIYLLVVFLFSLPAKTKRLVAFLTAIVLVFAAANYALAVKHTDIASNTFPLHISDQDLTRTDYWQTANYLKNNLRGQDTFVTLTSEGFWYYAVNKPSPVKYPIVWFAAADFQRRELAQEIADNPHIKFIITNTNWTSDIDFVPADQRIPEVYSVLYKDYKPYMGFGQQTIWKRD